MSKFKFGKCPQCGCEGIHACMGDIRKNSVDTPKLGMYNTLTEAIDHIKRSEAKTRRKRKNG